MLAGRILLASVFVFSILGHLANFDGMRAYMEEYRMPMTGFFLTASLGLRIFGSWALLMGHRTNLGVAALTLFLIPTTLIFHTDFSVPSEIIAFLENVGLQGGLLLLAASGPGRISMDARARERNFQKAALIAASF